MKNVIKKLQYYSKQVKLKDRFNFDFNVNADTKDSLFNAQETAYLLNEKTIFDKNVKLKWLLNEKYTTQTQHSELDFWIIQHWGGIRGFKHNDRNLKFKQQIIRKKLSLDCFSTISSMSKIASFMAPNSFVIYDSKVIYALNWLILTCENQKAFK